MQPSYEMAEVTSLRVPPHSIEAEQSVLGGIFIDASKLYSCQHITPEDFYRKDHELIFQTILTLDELNQPFDVVTVAERLESDKKLDEIGGLAYLATLAENTPSQSNIKAYADIVHKRSVLRKLVHATTEIGDAVFNPEGKSSNEILDLADSLITALTSKNEIGGLEHVKDSLLKTIDGINERFHSNKPLTGISSGLRKLDDITGGFQNSDLIVLAGRPSMGKTAAALTFVHNAMDEHKVAIFSLEMPKEQLNQRLLAMRGHIPLGRIREGKLLDPEWPKLTQATKDIVTSKLYIDDTGGLNARQIRARARRLVRKHGLDLLVIDYLGLMGGLSNKNTKNEIVEETTRQLKGLAKELNIPIILLCQLNRSLEHRLDKRPVMSDLRDSGAIEQDADVIIFLYRDEVYNEESSAKGTAEFIIAKQRQGEIGTKHFCFQPQFTKFENL